jgi:hypothetical protein
MTTITIKLIRRDPALAIPLPPDDGIDLPIPADAGVVSTETFDTWPALFDALRGYGVPITPEHEAEIQQHPETHFNWQSWVDAGVSAYLTTIQFSIEVQEGGAA